MRGFQKLVARGELDSGLMPKPDYKRLIAERKPDYPGMNKALSDDIDGHDDEDVG